MTGSHSLPPENEVRSIACLMINGIGDIMCVTPTLTALRQRYPNAHVTLIIRQHLRGLVEGSRDVDALLFYETARPWDRLAFFWRTRRRRFDLWVDLHVPTFNTVSSNERDFFRNAMLMRMAGARYRVAYAVPQLLPYLTHPVAVPNSADLRRLNIVDTTLALAAPQPGQRYRKYIPISRADRKWAEDALPDAQELRFALFFGSRQSADLWPTERIADFLQLLVQAWPQAELVLIGGEHEAEFADKMNAWLPEAARSLLRNFIGKASFSQTAALLARCNAMVSTDSGPMHIADAVGIPIVALFSSKNHHEIWRPVDSRAIVINHAVECGPCFAADCRFDNKCMKLIEPTEVLAALRLASLNSG